MSFFSTKFFEEKNGKIFRESKKRISRVLEPEEHLCLSLLEPILVEAYSSKVPLNQVSNISVPESRLITVQVWDESLIQSKCHKKLRLRIKPYD